MRLLRREDNGSFSLAEFVGEDAPPYTILSHTWGPDSQEVTYQDILQNTGRQKKGYNKIHLCAHQTEATGFEYFWYVHSIPIQRIRLTFVRGALNLANTSITIAVDKSSSAELTESINSMYRWYEAAEICFVFLEDLPSGQPLATGLRFCRWFSRGWTLQELIAPRTVEFFNQAWGFVGTKRDHAELISSFTSIPPCILLEGIDEEPICVAAKMSWAAGRQTKRKEDAAYCLLGLFDVHMPLIYGEGDRAFQRLQEEIVKRNNDITIFAWDLLRDRADEYIGLFAPSPANFVGSFAIRPFVDVFIEFSTTNKGVLLTSEIRLRTANIQHREDDSLKAVYFLCLGIDLQLGSGEKERRVGVYLRKLGPRLYCRLGNVAMARLPVKVIRQLLSLDVTATHILIDPKAAHTDVPHRYRMSSVHVPNSDIVRVEAAYPITLWDHTDRLYMSARFYGWTLHPVVLALSLSVYNHAVVLLCDCKVEPPVLKAFPRLQRPRETAIMFQDKYREDGMSWHDLRFQAPDLKTLDNTVTIRQESTSLRMSFALEAKDIRVLGRSIVTRSLTVSIVHCPTSSDEPLGQSELGIWSA